MKLEINAIISIMLVHQVASLLAVIIDVVVVSISSIFFLLHVVVIAIICAIIIHNIIGRMVYAASVRGIMEICIGQAWRKAEE